MTPAEARYCMSYLLLYLIAGGIVFCIAWLRIDAWINNRRR